MKQKDAEDLAVLFHTAEAAIADARKTVREADKAMKKLHALLTPAMPALGEKLGIDVAPLSGGTPKPPR